MEGLPENTVMKIESGNRVIRRQLFKAGSNRPTRSACVHDPVEWFPSMEAMTKAVRQVINQVSPLPVGRQAVLLPFPNLVKEGLRRRHQMRRDLDGRARRQFGFKSEEWPIRVRFRMRLPGHSKARKDGR